MLILGLGMMSVVCGKSEFLVYLWDFSPLVVDFNLII